MLASARAFCARRRSLSRFARVSWISICTSKRQGEVSASTCPSIGRKQDGRHVAAVEGAASVVISAFATKPYVSAAVIKVNTGRLCSGL